MKLISTIFLWTALVVCFPFPTFSQDLLKTDTSGRCVYTGKYFGEELYRFEANATIQSMITRILTATDRTQNFTVVHSNVSSVAAIIDKGQRYLLFNYEFFIAHQRDTPFRFAVLAHEIGHLTNPTHTLNGKQRLKEESEADIFTGEALQALGFSLQKTLAVADFSEFSYNITPNNRKKYLERGWKTTDARLKTEENAGYLNEEKALSNIPIPRFPWPPPQCARRKEIDKALFGTGKLKDVDALLKSALDKCKYGQQSYYYVPNGFALVTQLEQYNEIGTCKTTDADRWKDYPVPNDMEGWGEMFGRYFNGHTGYFRIFVFVVTDQAYVMDTKKIITKEEGKAWLQAGANTLPDAIGNLSFSKEHKVSVLVYEFEAKSSTNKAEAKCPGRLEPDVHLDKSGIKKNIRKRA